MPSPPPPAGELRQIAFYGKGGIGKSTVVANLSSALVADGKRVLQVGCDPKHDSSRPFWGDARPPTLMDLLDDDAAASVAPRSFVHASASGVEYLEVGGPEPGVGCAGRGILKMFEIFQETRLLRAGYDAVLYDVLGDVVCGGFAAPIRSGHASEVFVVVSGEFMAIYAANNVCRSIATHAERRRVRLGGLILNCRDVPNEVAVVTAFAERLGTRVVGVVPRSGIVSDAERRRRTVVEAFAGSELAETYRRIARAVFEPGTPTVPARIGYDELEELYYRLRDA